MTAATTALRLQNLVVGIGSPHGADRMGWSVAERLSPLLSERWEVRLARVPTDLLDWIEQRERLVIVDACRSLDGEEIRQRRNSVALSAAADVSEEVPLPLGASGRVHFLSWPSQRIESVDWRGAHEMNLVPTLQLAERLGMLPKMVSICAIDVGDAGSETDSEQAALCEIATQEILRTLESSRTHA